MKTTFYLFTFLTFSFSFSVASQNAFNFFSEADMFFKEACQNQRVDYKNAAKSDRLQKLVDYIAQHEIIENEKKAYLINAYNLFVIHKTSRSIPFKSPSDDGGFFTDKSQVLNGKNVSLNSIENGILRPKYKDPRLHFVLVCGAVSCPPIANYAYTPENLHMQLDKQTVAALNDASFVYDKKKEKTVYLSQIFEWYKSDFGKNNQEVIEYINNYRVTDFASDAKVKFYPYNWQLNSQSNPIHNNQSTFSSSEPEQQNLQLYTAGSLLGKGKLDLTLFNTMYTETKQNWLGVDYSGYRTTFMTHLFQVTLGVSKNKRINLGLDISLRNSGKSTDSTVNGLRTAFAYTNNDSTRFGITSVGFRVKIQPFKDVSHFTLQSTISGPTVKHPEGFNGPSQQNLFWADWNRITWWNQLYYTKNFGKFQLFTELDFLYRFRINKDQIGMLDIPMNVFLSYFPTKKITVYAMTQHVPRFTNDIDQNSPATDWVIPSNYTASGVGFKYQLLSNLNLELLYTNFWRSKNAGLGSTFNLGIKFLTK
ncbi:MAG TPA: DUF547 domain-containing protein [Crocinitomicaceae bacterium]|nr:DUF547 domain-containing protein [Crocinitomicaceae bacterium]